MSSRTLQNQPAFGAGLGLHPIRIMHVIDSLARGGLQRGLVNLIQRMDPERYEHVVCVMRPADSMQEVSFSGVNVRVVSLAKDESDSRIEEMYQSLRTAEASPIEVAAGV